jgi:hypothetical protein
MKKAWYTSKMLWVNAIAAIAIGVQSHYGFVISPELQGYALTAINFVLRIITKQELGE